jgi:hypothetical protein
MFDITAIVVAALSVISSIILGVMQIGKWRAEAKKARTESDTDLIRAALEINKQEIETLREVIQIQRETITELRRDDTIPLKKNKKEE